MKTEITELLGIEYPVIQGGMAWVAECHLAAAEWTIDMLEDAIEQQTPYISDYF